MGSFKMLSHQNHSSLVFLMLFIFCFHSQLTSSSPSHPQQCHALLQFKSNFVINPLASLVCFESSYPKTESWKDSTDCCSSWEGVTCDGESGLVIGLDLSCSQLQGTIHSNSSLFSSHLAPYLLELNLAFNDFQGSKISSEFGVKFGSSLTHLNLSESGFSGNIPSEISHLSNIVSLDLSSTHYPGLRVESDRVVERIAQNLTQLRALNLDWSNMSSVHASTLMNLSSSLTFLSLWGCQLQGQFLASFLLRPNLQEVDLSFNNNLRFINTSLPQTTPSNNLRLLDLSYTDLSTSVGFLDFVGNHLKSLRHLDLSDCNITGSILPSFGNLIELTHLYLGENHLSGLIPPSFGNLIELTDLYLQGNQLSGPIPASLGNLTNLVFLYLRNNHLNGPIPTTFSNMPYLTDLYMDDNKLGGPITPSLGNLTNIVTLLLYYNHLSGPIPTSFSNLTRLVELDMSYNELDGPLPSYLFALPSLEKVDLSSNNLHGQIPTAPIKSINLARLDLSNNNLSGSQDFDVFLTLRELNYLDLSINNISSSSTSISTNLTYSLPSLEYLLMSGCNLNQFPTFVKALTNLKYLDVSNNQIQGPIPDWIYDVGKDTLSSIDLSGNRLTSVVHQLHWKNIQFIDFHSNHLQGPLPIPPTSTTFFSVSNNTLSGEIDSLICNLCQLESLDLSHNKFTGSIPQCLGSMSNLSMLNLGMNRLHGHIPDTFANHSSLNSLVLNGNHLTGTIPQTLSYCHNLQILDVGNNMIQDTAPHWLEALSSLEVLVLRSNKFYGSLNGFKEKLLFPALKILDLSNNNFTGRFPIKLMKNLYALTKVDEKLEDGRQYMSSPNSSYSDLYYSVVITVKGLEMGYVKIMTTFATIDLSVNKFEGHIPEVIGKLISLKGLNLSHNLLTGHIPASMGHMGSLEWLDLSHNELSGQIPRELTDLTFLQVLDLSSNQLDGAIPQGKQFNTFGNDSYKDNLALCGFPLTKTCGPNPDRPSDTSKEKSSSYSEGGFSWEGAFAGYGCGIVLGLSVGYIVFKTRSPKWFVKMVEGKQRGRVGKRSKRRARTRN